MQQRRPRRFCRPSAALLMLAMLFASAPRVAGADHPGTIPGTLRIGVTVAPNTLNPMFSTALSETFVGSFIFDGLVDARPDGVIQPVLAAIVPTTTNGGISRDGRTLTYHLRHDVRWQDGAPFTSADVAFTQRAIMNPANNVVVRQPYDRVVRLDTPDAYTVVVHLRAPYAPFIAQWITIAVLPAHLLAGKHDLNDDPFNGAPVGTGAFRLEHWDRGNAITFAANRAYFAGPPRLQRIVVSLIPDDNAAALALRTHAIDWFYGASPPAARLLASMPDVRIERFDQNAQEGAYLNVARPLLRDLRVRRALSLGVDRAGAAAKLGFGYLVPATADIPSSMWAYDPSLRAPYDPARAAALLDTAGWKPGSDGIRVRDGTRLSLVYLYASGKPVEAGYALQFAASLRAIGVELQLKSLAPNVLYAPNGPGYGGDFDLAFTPFTWAPDPDNTQLFSCATLAPHGNNWSRWCNADFERWTAVALTQNDRAARRAAYAHIEHLILDDVPEIVATWPLDVEPVSIDVRGLRNVDELARPYRWSI